MQFLSPVKPVRAPDFHREAPAGKHLPYARHLDANTIELRDGMIMQVLRIGGLQFETADSDELNYRTHLRDSMLRSLGSSRFAVYHHLVRRPAVARVPGEFADGFSQWLDERWRACIDARQLYVNELYLTIVYRPIQGRVGLADRLRDVIARSSSYREDELAKKKYALDKAREAIVASLSQYDPELLTIVDTAGGAMSEPLSFLGWLFNHEKRPVIIPKEDLGHHLPTRRVSFGLDTIERAPAGHLGRTFTAMISLKDWPSRTMPGMFDALTRLPFAFDFCQSFAIVERREALSRMNLVLRRMRSAEDEALSLLDELVTAKDDVAAGRAAFGEHHMTIAIHGEDPETLNSNVSEITALLADLGIHAVREDTGLELAFWAQFPGNFRYIARRGVISSTNFASLASLHNFPLGKARNSHWGDPVTVLETTAAGPYFFNFHKGDLGNFTIIGPSGSGKTVVLNFLLCQARRFAPRIIFFDKDRGAELFIRAIGGSYDRLSPGIPSGLNPLQLPDTPGNRAFLLDWLANLAGETTSAELETIRQAVALNFAQPRESRRLRFLVDLFRGGDRPRPGDLYARLRPWWGEGEYAWLFDNALDKTDLSQDAVGFDMTAILDDPTTRTPAMLYLFHRVEERLDGSPAIVVVDEGWKALDDAVFVRKVKDWQKTIRKRNGIVGFATQSAQDALESEISSAIIEQAATQIFMINPKARAEDYMNGFGLTQHEFDLVRNLPDTSHCFLIRHGKESVVARLDLTGETDLLTILSGRESTVTLFDRLKNDLGEVPEQWILALLKEVA